MKFRNLTAVLALAFLLLASGDDQPARSFHLYYGNSPVELAKLRARFESGAIVVIDTRVLKDETLKALHADARASGALLLGYLSIGEIHEDEIEELKRYLDGDSPLPLVAMTIDRNETFNSARVDVLAKPLRSWLHRKATEVLDRGVDGLFLDTVDTVDRYLTRESWDLDRRKQSVDAMISLIRSFKETHPDAYILQNGGLNLIGETAFIGNAKGILAPALNLAKTHPSNPDGLLWENAFAGTDAWSKGRLEELRRIREAGHVDVFALGYEASFEDVPKFLSKCRENRFVGAWAKSSEVLHVAATVSGPDEPRTHSCVDAPRH